MSNLAYLTAAAICMAAVAGDAFGHLVLKAIELHYSRAHTPRL